MIAPPGTPGAATIVMAKIRINSVNRETLYTPPLIRIKANAQDTILSILPDKCIVAHKGTTKDATSSETPLRLT